MSSFTWDSTNIILEYRLSHIELIEFASQVICHWRAGDPFVTSVSYAYELLLASSKFLRYVDSFGTSLVV